MSLLDAAIAYARRGWRVFPCRPRGKAPLTPHGVKDATTDPETIRRWWRRWPEANIGLACGASGLAVLDVDPRAGGDESLRDLLQRLGREALETVTAETGGGGLHLYFRSRGGARCSAGALGEGLDVKADGGYVIAPPSVHPNGNEYQWAYGYSPDERAVAPLPTALAELMAKPAGRSAPATGGEERIAEGQRNATLASLAGAMRRRGMTAEAIEAALLAENARRCDPPLETDEVRRIAASIARYEPARPAYHRSDLGNARRFVDRYHDKIRFDCTSERWLIWNGTRWEEDQDGEAMRLAKETVLAMLDELSAIDEREERKGLFRFILASENAGRLAAMLKLAQTEPEIALTRAALDADPWLFNCLNGTVDLRTGELRPHSRDDLITRMAPARYDPDATFPLWERFLRDATGDDEELIAFLARAAGYSLTGDCREEKLFFVHGPTNSGKSTFLEALKAMLGDYATTADFETFLSRSFVGGPRPDIARLAGARFVASIEVDEGKRLAEGLVKQLTGGDTVTARFLYQSEFEFTPQFKLWLAANHAPEIQHDDAAMWRRILRVPFEIVVPEGKRDPTLKMTLKNDDAARAAILAWAVRGCLDWQRQGLAVPERVRRATDQYRLAQDPLREFILSCCLLSERAMVPAGELRREYEAWCKENGEKPLYGAAWGEALRARGCKQDNVRISGTRTRVWRGIGLTAADDAEEEPLPF